MLTHKTQKDAALFLLSGRMEDPTTSDFCSYLYRHPDGTVRGLAAEYRRVISELRREGYVIVYNRGSGFGKGYYRLVSAPIPVQADGQLNFMMEYS